MDFPNWLDAERGRQTRVAEHFNVTPSAVSQWRQNGVPPDNMLAVRDFTGGEVTLEEMLRRPARPAQSAQAAA